ncbi:MAG: MutS-related protein, partial [Helicobacteraceae bacterium]
MLLKKLDLESFIASFKEEFAREKDVFLPGDTAFFYPIIKEFSKLDLAPAPRVKNLEKPLLHLQRSGVLGMEDIASFVKIALYFRYVKGLDLGANALAWLDKIVLDPGVLALGEFFGKQGEFLQEKDERLLNLERRQNALRASLKEHLHGLLSSPRLREFLVDSALHYINDNETLLVRGGFARVLDASVAARSAAGFFYVIPRQSEIFLRQIQELQDKKLAVIYEYEQNFSKLLFGKLAFLRFLDREFDKLDHIIARAAFAKKRGLSLVKTTGKKQIILKNFIHPSLKDPVPFSVDFSKSILMITGVNAGGKTMLLKSILSACFLAKHLIPFACDEYETQIGSFSAIAAIINDDQSSADNISTFAARMREFSAVSNERDLLLGIDEIELGTDSDEAAALFKVMLEHLSAHGAKIVITTHHKRLAALMAKHDFVELLAALFDEQKMLPLYGFMQGAIGNSYAFETALRYGIGRQIVDEARKVYGEDKIHLNLLIQKSSMLELEQTKRLQDLDARRAELERHYAA